jgi:hypothetical protein
MDVRAAPAEAGAPERVRLGVATLAALPGLLVVYFGFNGGGFFAATPALAALVMLEILAARVVLARHPFAGFTPALMIAAAALAGFAGWVLASRLWSQAPGRALLEFDRALLYLLILVLFGSVPRGPATLPRMLRGLAAGIFVVCVAGLLSRLLPHVWPTAPNVANQRLSFPLTYWNTMGLLAAIGIVLCLHLASSRDERPLVRALGAGAVPLLATTLYFTFSRGGILVGITGVALYVALARPGRLPGGLLATVPTSAVAVVAAYRADLLASFHPATAAAAAQGAHVAWIVGACALAAATARMALRLLERRAVAPRALSATGRRLARATVGGLIVAAIAVALLAGAPHYFAGQYRQFIRGAPISATDLRGRLTDPSSNERSKLWRVAFATFGDAPIGGTGAGSYQLQWERRRREAQNVIDAHSLYFEVPAELGIVGLALLVIALGTIIIGLARRIRGRHGGRYAACLAGVLVWAIHAGFDWDWEMPVATAWVFAVGGAALAARDGVVPRSAVPRGARAAIAACLVVVGILPTLVMLSQGRLQRSADALARGDCRVATEAARSSISALGSRRAPYEILGYCDIKAGRPRSAVAAMSQAVDRDPNSWESHYGLAIARGYAGLDPLPQARRAMRLNPLQPLVRQAVRLFTPRRPTKWRRGALDASDGAVSSGQLLLK